MDDYSKILQAKFGKLRISLVRHDTSPTGYPCYIEVDLEHNPKNKGAIVLDLGNYIYRTTGLHYQMTPEFRFKGKRTTLRWFMSWDDVRPILPNIWRAVLGETPKHNHEILPLSFQSVCIQDATRNVRRTKS